MSGRRGRGSVADRALDALATLAIAVWLGGYATLGAVVAPLVFGMVPAPTSGDAMTAVFQRFDRVALACAAVALLCEVGHAALRARPITRLDMARAALVGLASALAVYLAMVVTPHIVELHRSGAVRGSGPAGLELDAVHHTAETLAKLELGVLAVALVLFAFRGRGAAAGLGDARALIGESRSDAIGAATVPLDGRRLSASPRRIDPSAHPLFAGSATFRRAWDTFSRHRFSTSMRAACLMHASPTRRSLPMTFTKSHVAAAACISVLCGLGGLAACSTTTSSGGGGGSSSGANSSSSSGGVYKPLEDSGIVTPGNEDAAAPTVGNACTTATQCTAPAYCTAQLTEGPVFPSPMCIYTGCTAGAGNEIAFCGNGDIPGSGICTPQGAATVCLPLCFATTSAVTGCLANDVCQIEAAGALQTGAPVQAFGICQPGCTSNSQCPTGSSCDTYEGACVTTVTAQTQPTGSACNPSSTSPVCPCFGNPDTTTGICSSTCVTGGPACPQPAGDAGVSNPYVCSALLGGVNQIDAGITFTQQPPGLFGSCIPECHQDSDCTAVLGTGATCTADPAAGPSFQGVCYPPQ